MSFSLKKNMISQRCPKCLSKRVRHGYRPTPLWSKLLMRYNLLCDHCNWEFIGFAVPGTISHKPSEKIKYSTETVTRRKSEDQEEDPEFYKTASASKK